MSIPFKQSLTKEQALEKVKHYCAYQERCHQEVRLKLISLGLRAGDLERLISQLIEENYLNESRFAIQYAGGKFRIKQWGRLKIRNSLKQKQVGEYCIKKALEAIDEKSYLQTLEKLAQRKLQVLKDEKNILIKKKKTMDYLFQKGFEMDLVMEMVNALQSS